MNSVSFGTLSLGAVLSALTLITAKLYTRNRLPLPPGPPKKSWLSGNAADMPKGHPWLKFTEWARGYGDIVHLRVHTNNIIILSSYEGILELFEKRGALYSQRPRRMMILMMGWGKLIAFTGHGKRWKAYRKYANSGFSKTAVLKYHGGQTKDVHVFLQRLLNSPEDFAKQLNMLVGMIIMRITYGYQVQEAGDPFVTISDEAIASMSTTGVAGRYLVDSYPFLRFLPTWLPGMKFKAMAQEWSKLPYRMVEEPYQWVRKQMGTMNMADMAKWTAGSMYNAGSHTTAREEMDRVVGTDRLPTMSDRPKLPYLECILLETMRWYPVTPLTVPHRVEREDMYQGYRIPANSTVFANIYAITRDERIFPNPEAFIPERFDGTQPGPTPLDPREFVFGIGRRICPGNTVADATIFLVMANLVATMDITKAKDENGHEIEPQVVRTGGLVR
ncbi:cytochrome P450 family protein [Rhizoctonia solani]|uniref:Cytochrome P450 family protein n=1 Tax=Rhizoctonia solani TaxID=456999 RepID=A0A8H8SV84_9AGAM|nr:cytochrome P450 family protein [Rhizoctonia solani]QRW17878.1 cytochrome P450 family protein [Rhizoctonia solani]